MILRFEPLEGRQVLSLVFGGQGVGSGGTPATDTSTTTQTTTKTIATASQTSALTPATGLPDLVATKDTAPSNLDWDESFALGGTITNQGNAATAADFNVDVYASTGAKLLPGAVRLGTVVVPAGLAAGQSYHFEQTFSTPQTPLKNLNGQTSYYVVLAVDTGQAVAESNEANNANRGLQGEDAAMVTITPRQPAQLAAAGLAVSPNGTEWGSTLHVQATVRNSGAGDAPPTNARIILAPLGQDPFGPNGYTVGSVPMPTILAGQTVAATQDITLPKEPPTSLAKVSAFSLTMVVDDGQQADPVVTPMKWQGENIDWTRLNLTAKDAATPAANLPDLKVDSVQNPASVAWGQTFTVKTTVENHGKSDAGAFKVRFFLVQGDDANAPTLALGDATVDSLKASSSQEITQTIKLPARVPDGLNGQAVLGRIVAQANYDHALDEASLDDNTLRSAPIGLNVVGTDGTSTPVVITPADNTPQTPPAGQPAAPTPAGNQGQPQTPPANTNPLQAERLAARRQKLQARIEYLRSLRQNHQQPHARVANLPNHPSLRIYNGSNATPTQAARLRIAAQGPNRIA